MSSKTCQFDQGKKGKKGLRGVRQLAYAARQPAKGD
jgi:hypothetical protein